MNLDFLNILPSINTSGIASNAIRANIAIICPNSSTINGDANPAWMNDSFISTNPELS